MSMHPIWMIRIIVHQRQDIALFLVLGPVEGEEVVLRELRELEARTVLLCDGLFWNLYALDRRLVVMGPMFSQEY